MKNHFIVTAICLLFFISANAANKVFNIKEYGAKHSTNEKDAPANTTAIQAAIDACSDNGGGIVLVPKGVYVTGTLHLKSNVTIQMEAWADLIGSPIIEDYTEVPVATEEPHFSRCLFYAEGAENIKITGENRSEINGRGYFFKFNRERPKLFRFEKCRNVEIENITVKNSGSWCVVFTECDSVKVSNITLYNKENRNNDGIDLDGCSNVWITGCNLQVLDDALCLKSSVDKICENIFISDCTVSSYTSAVKFGTASKTGFRNVRIKNCQFFDCWYGAIKLLAVDGAILEDVEISDIQLFDCNGPIFLRLGNRGRSYDKSIKQIYSEDAKPEGRPVGKLRNITIKNVEGTLRTRQGLYEFKECILLTGIPGHYIQDVTLENIHLSYAGYGDLDVRNREVPEMESRYPEQSHFGILPSYGMYLRHVKGLKVKNVTMALRCIDNRPAIMLDDVHESKFDQVSFDIKPEAGSALVIKNSSNIKLNKVIPSGGVEQLMEIEGGDSESIQLTNCIE